jgi:hypothetical protein
MKSETIIHRDIKPPNVPCCDCMVLGQLLGLPCHKHGSPAERAELDRICAAQVNAMMGRAKVA